MSKYHSIKTVVDGIAFDSRREAQRYRELALLQRVGAISGLRLQVPYELIPKHEIAGIKVRASKYIADFVYIEDGTEVVEDVKGYRTADYKRKKLQMKQRYGIEIRET